jgi:hypothetical protein
MRAPTSSSDSDPSVSSSDRLSSGEMTLKCGFSVVAPTSETQRFSTPGRRASCWVLLNRCTSSTNSTVSVPLCARARRAPAMTSRTSLTPAETAEISMNRRLVCRLMSEAMVVLPVPGGPHSSRVSGWSASMTWRSGDPAASRCSWPTSSSSVRGRIRTASGADEWSLPARLPPPPGAAGAGWSGRSNSPSSLTLRA